MRIVSGNEPGQGSENELARRVAGRRWSRRRAFTVDVGARQAEDVIMPEPNPTSTTSVYQLRVVLREISPLIWRRLLVRAHTSLPGLHDVVQLAFGWSGEHLHRFVVHGVDHDAGAGYDLAQVCLADLGLRVTERFVYDYDLGVLWRHDIRVEQVLAVEAGRTYPVCIAGRRAGPPEECAGRGTTWRAANATTTSLPWPPCCPTYSDTPMPYSVTTLTS
jgi:Plasmid pRiA4b ORF-3-like protein